MASTEAAVEARVVDGSRFSRVDGMPSVSFARTEMDQIWNSTNKPKANAKRIVPKKKSKSEAVKASVVQVFSALILWF